ncbi:MAG: hypothetical protein HY094_07860 [Candidatus Melainabacteria bacterium]|nr:hypothetical protein [Candidatus Melainabacteria bacterium]
MTFAVNQLVQILLHSIPYKPCSVRKLAVKLQNYIHKPVKIAYFSRVKNEKDEIVDLLEAFEIKKGYDFNKKHTHNLVVLYLRERGIMFFVDGNRINSNLVASNTGFIHSIRLTTN